MPPARFLVKGEKPGFWGVLFPEGSVVTEDSFYASFGEFVDSMGSSEIFFFDYVDRAWINTQAAQSSIVFASLGAADPIES
jgi:hypothetical protein